MSPKSRNPINSYAMEIPEQAVSFDADAFDMAIRSHGVSLIHYAALRCPVGMTDLDDNRRPHSDHAGCSNGFLYQKVGCVQALLTGNSNKQDLRDIGFVDGESVVSTFPRTYEDGLTPFYMAPFDRFYLNEETITVPTWQLAKCHESGAERLLFPAVCVERLVDSRGDSYREGQDFSVNDGQVEWVDGGRRPMNDLETGRGAIISIRYRYRPYFYLARMMHEVRVAQIENPLNSDRTLVRMPQQALLNREFLFQNEQDSVLEPRSPRKVPEPDSGGFGER